MELKQLQSFCAVVQYRSFTRAAEKLYLSQPTVSTHIRQLEEEFGSRLIVRTTKSIEVTPRGQELYACACGIVHLRDDLLRSWSDEDEKVIRIGASTIPSAYILPQILPAFRREHPAPQFHVFQSDSEGIAEGLLTGSFDVGLIGARIHEEALELTGLTAQRAQSVLTLSGGELQRTFLAQVLAQQPRLLILDEPTNHLDLVYQKQVFSLIGRWLREPGRAVVSVVHDLSLARAFGTDAVLLHHGKTVASGSVREVLRPENLDAVYDMDVAAWMRQMLSQWE